jgi:uncharacterized protein affecting Mg2+/Co2+ transport
MTILIFFINVDMGKCQQKYVYAYDIFIHNGQKKKYKRTNNDLQNIHIKLKTVLHEI